MKKISLAAAILLICVLATFARGTDPSYADDPGPSVKNQFADDFPDAKNVHFARLKDLNEVSFTQGKDEMIAYYDDRSELTGTIQKESFADLPDNAKKEIQHKYAGYTIGNVVQYHDNESDDTEMVLYEKSMDDGDNYFVELKNDSKAIIVKVNLSGGVDYLTTMK
jgi:hypothetical protein